MPADLDQLAQHHPFRSPSSRARFLGGPTAPYSKPKRATRPPTKPHQTPTASKRSAKSATSVKNAVTPLTPGDVLDGKWKILRLLGAGGMGVVYEAEHVGNGRRVAIKTLQPDLARGKHSALARAELLREARVGNLVDEASRIPVPTGPGTVSVYDDGKAKGVGPYVVMGQLHGKTLEDASMELLRRGSYPSPVGVARAMDEVLHVLEAAHAQGIIHRDIKPQNLFATDTGDVKVLDWGLAQVPGDTPTPGSFLGTPGFAPPEQVLGLTSKPSSDTWSVGATGYKLLTGKPPVPYAKAAVAGEEYLAVVNGDVSARILSGRRHPNFKHFPTCPVPPVRSVAPHVPEHIAEVVDKALACDPKERYRTATAMREDLEAAISKELNRA